MAQYRLNVAETVPVTLYMMPITRQGKVTYNNYLRLEPGKVYETDDVATIAYLKEKTQTVKYKESIENALKDANIDYEVEFCRSCGGRVKKIKYHLIEVVE